MRTLPLLAASLAASLAAGLTACAGGSGSSADTIKVAYMRSTEN